ncbi:Protein kinase, putative [Hondaea fermentalgiana]|uniref:non-specific serine/threonine protein kinase n=1 Tax=Hondaea fermentalgiana TaxID=2315210 RepID=A0A2R5G5C3_9STRA|nr:Protein kinase, putative [Hondaea fermentalgiana]|eukprot:GBG26237.1 Protein kinase, putative [Hondaea fermentalgiana]
MGKRWSALSNSASTPHTEDFHSQLVRLESSFEEYDRAYEEGATLGEGITGCVKEVTHEASGKRFAMKSINLDRIDKAQVKELKTEIGILKQLDHPNIVRLHEVYQNKNNIRIIMELLTGGDLARRKLETEESIRRVIFQLVSACRYWHARGVVHRDLKLENIMFSNNSEDSDVKVIDFGLGTTFYSEELLQERQQRRRRADSDKYSSAKALVSSIENGLVSPRLRALRIRHRTTSSRFHATATDSDTEGSLSQDSPGEEREPSQSPSPPSSDAHKDVEILRQLEPPPLSIGESGHSESESSFPERSEFFEKSEHETSITPRQDLQQQQQQQASQAKDDVSAGAAFKLASEKMGDKLRRGSYATVAKVRRSALGSPGTRHIPSRRNVVKSRIFQTTCGTAYYMAPEIMFGRGYTEKCDLWAIGVITYMLIARRPPFPGKNEKEVFHRMRTSVPSFQGRSWERASPEACEFCKNLLKENPSLRWTAEEALASAWLSSSDEDLAQPALDTELAVILSMKRFARYSTLKRAVLMVVSHNQSNFQDTKLNHCFLAIDKSNQGYIRRDDLRDFILSRDEASDEATVDRIFESMDQGRSGHIRYMEFLAATIEISGPVSDEMVETAFQHLDTERSGYISRKSLKRMLGKGFAKRDLAKIIAETSPETKISFEAFQAMMKATPSLPASGSRVLFDAQDAGITDVYSAEEEEFDDDVYYDALFVDSDSDNVVYEEEGDEEEVKDDAKTTNVAGSQFIKETTQTETSGATVQSAEAASSASANANAGASASTGATSRPSKILTASSSVMLAPRVVSGEHCEGEAQEEASHHEEHNPDPRFVEARQFKHEIPLSPASAFSPRQQDEDVGNVEALSPPLPPWDLDPLTET